MNEQNENGEYTITTMAASLGKSFSTVYKWIKRGWVNADERESSGGERISYVIPPGEYRRVENNIRQGKRIAYGLDKNLPSGAA